MTRYLNVNIENALSFIEVSDYQKIEAEIKAANKTLREGTGLGNDFLGWVSLPTDYDKSEFARIKDAALRIRENSDILLVIGIGGSYLGSKAVTELLSKHFDKNKGLEIIFVGHQISSNYMSDLIKYIDGKNFSINVISKSGTTTEPAIAFRIFKDLLEKKYGKEGSKRRIFATTDKERGALKKLATEEGYETFVVPDNVGGRYSVLTAVGLLPIAAAGIDVDKLMQGARDAMVEYQEDSINSNVYKYVAIRNLLYRSGKKIEIMVNYEPEFLFFAEWWKQLFGESEGKEGKGIFPTSAMFSTDLHSLGQIIQDGERNIFETVINVEKVREEIIMDAVEGNLDGLNYLTGHTLDFVNKNAFKGTLLAHIDGGVPNIVIDIPEISEYSLGHLIYFFELACGISGYVLGVNPFDQPGVEAYKKNMFALLGKPGYEELKADLEKKLL